MFNPYRREEPVGVERVRGLAVSPLLLIVLTLTH